MRILGKIYVTYNSFLKLFFLLLTTLQILSLHLQNTDINSASFRYTANLSNNSVTEVQQIFPSKDISENILKNN